MRNLKKLLAVVIAVTILLTAMVPAFAATSYVYEDEAQTLNDLDLYAGTSTSEFVPDLGASLTRAQGAVLVLKMFNLLDEAYKADAASVAETLATFKDAKKVPTWADEAVAYAVENGIVSGRTDGNFDPAGKLKAKDFATMVLKQLGYTPVYATAAAQLAELDGLEIDNEEELLRDDVVGMIYNTLDVKYADGKSTIIEALVAANPELKDIAVAAGLIDATASSATVAATGAKLLTVTFNSAIDTAKATFSVKKGTITVNVSKVTFADDKKSAKLELATKLTEGDYTVSVAGVTATAFTATTKVENEKVTKVEFTSPNAVLDATYDTQVTTSYKIFNQYAEDVTSSNSLTFSVGKGTYSVPTAGTLKLTVTAPSTFTLGEKVAVSAIHSSTSTFASAVLTVAPKAAVAEVTIKSLYNVDGNVPAAGATAGDYKLVLEAKDQYGTDVAPSNIAGDVIVTVSNTTVANIAGGVATPNFTSTTIDGEAKTTLALAGTLTAGTSTVAIISKTTGKLAKFDVVIKETVKVDSLSLSVPELAVAGEKVNIPFTAVDQFGAAITGASDLTAGMNSLTAGSYGIAFKQDYVKNTAYLELDLTAATAATTVFVTGVTKTNKVVTLQVSVVDPKTPVVINNTKDLTVNVAVGGTITLGENNLIAKDQYGRDITPTFGAATGNYQYAIETSDSAKVGISAAVITADDGSITLSGAAKGTSTITVKIQKKDTTWVDVDNSAITFDVKVVEKADITSYELGDFTKLYQASGTTHDVALTVNGLLANGAKVAVPASYFMVTINDANVGYNTVDGTVYATTRTWDSGVSTIEIPVIVTVFGSNGPVILNKNVTVASATPSIATVELVSNGIATKEADGVASVVYTDARAGVAGIVVAAVKTVDQYGVEVTEAPANYSYIAATNLPDGRAADLSNIAAGDTFNVIAITTTGKSITFKVIVK